MTRESRFDDFAALYTDQSQPTFENATACYMAMYPNASKASAGVGGSRLLNDERTQRAIAEIRLGSRAIGVVTPAQYNQKSMDMANQLFDKAMETNDPRWATVIPKLLENVGKASGFFVTKTEDVTPVERKFPPTPELIGNLRLALDRFDRLNAPNAMPILTAGQTPIIVDVDYTVGGDENGGEDREEADGPAEDGGDDVRRVAGLSPESAGVDAAAAAGQS